MYLMPLIASSGLRKDGEFCTTMRVITL